MYNIVKKKKKKKARNSSKKWKMVAALSSLQDQPRHIPGTSSPESHSLSHTYIKGETVRKWSHEWETNSEGEAESDGLTAQ